MFASTSPTALPISSVRRPPPRSSFAHVSAAFLSTLVASENSPVTVSLSLQARTRSNGPFLRLNFRAKQGLHALCQSDEVDWNTCWSVIGQKMNAATHPLIIASLCVPQPYPLPPITPYFLRDKTALGRHSILMLTVQAHILRERRQGAGRARSDSGGGGRHRAIRRLALRRAHLEG